LSSGERRWPPNPLPREGQSSWGYIAAMVEYMTLNITVAARWLMAQSSDFRLNRSGLPDPVSESSQKTGRAAV
jgi:hypothetical protein